MIRLLFTAVCILGILTGCANRKLDANNPFPIRVFNNGHFILGTYTKSRELSDLVSKIKKEKLPKKQPLVIKAHSETHFAIASRALNLLEAAGFTNVRIEVQKEVKPTDTLDKK